MKLTELKPKWVVEHEYGDWDENLKTNPKRRGMGITFLCPHCQQTRIGVMFTNPIDGLKPAYINSGLWQRTGETFETLTLSPSIDTSQCKHWHGFITNGEAV
jgi:hypothetical protein